ncbi:MAG TPA: superoxide dismutase family protein [Anaeromyxobacteraceae bacterium]|nr:superoxide dismutase family protein [Anaeromyxobacteraceae bacterium]
MSRLALLAVLLVPAAAPAADPVAARAVLKNAKGATVGTAQLKAEGGGVAVALRVNDLPPGTHAFHVHAAGKCDPPDFLSAGPHFNPTGKKHGMKNPEGHHLGDLPSIQVGADGKGEAKALVEGASLGPGPNSLFGPQGTALVVHERPDDEMTDPAGNAGARIACGVIERS